MFITLNPDSPNPVLVYERQGDLVVFFPVAMPTKRKVLYRPARRGKKTFGENPFPEKPMATADANQKSRKAPTGTYLQGQRKKGSLRDWLGGVFGKKLLAAKERAPRTNVIDKLTFFLFS